MEDPMSANKWVPDEWLQADLRAQKGDARSECKSTKQHQTRHWKRTVFVPEGWQPVDIVNAYAFELPFPLPHAGTMGINKRDVECIASAMANPNLRWRNMCLFTVAPYEGEAGEKANTMNELGYVQNDYVGQPVLMSGHHRFLAFLLCGLPPPELPPVQMRNAPLTLPYVFPWFVVEWGK
jgi:hypothetical protein